MKIAVCSLMTLLFSAMAGVAGAGQFDDHRTGVNDGLAQRHLANYERRDSDWPRDKSAPAPVTAAPEISAESAISALVLLGGALILLGGRHGIKPKI
jgi:hypothetical protein